MRISIVIVAGVGLLGCGTGWADRVAGIAGIASTRAVPAQTAASAPLLRSGVVSGLRADGSQVEIDGKWYVVKPGRSLLLRDGLPIGASALAKGQKLRFSLASTVSGETGLGVVHVP